MRTGPLQRKIGQKMAFSLTLSVAPMGGIPLKTPRGHRKFMDIALQQTLPKIPSISPERVDFLRAEPHKGPHPTGIPATGNESENRVKLAMNKWVLAALLAAAALFMYVSVFLKMS